LTAPNPQLGTAIPFHCLTEGFLLSRQADWKSPATVSFYRNILSKVEWWLGVESARDSALCQLRNRRIHTLPDPGLRYQSAPVTMLDGVVLRSLYLRSPLHSRGITSPHLGHLMVVL